MLRRFLFGGALLLTALAVPLHAVGTVTVTTAAIRGQVARYTVAWTSTAGGAVSGNAFAIPTGRLLSIIFTPGSAAPTTLYDVTLIASDGTILSGDLLAGAGADRSATLSSVLTFDPPLFLDGTRTLDVVVANAGDTKTGRVEILVQQ